jgi:tetratricopeptide (TPR) repeat protein
MSMTDFNGFSSYQLVRHVEAAEPQTQATIDKNVQYTKRLQSALEQRPFIERQWRAYRAYPYFDRAARLAGSQDMNGALAEYEKYLTHDPDHLVMRWQQLLTLSQTDRLEETVASASALLQRVPDFAPALIIRGLTLRKLKQSDAAAQDFLAAQKDPALVQEDQILLLSELYVLALHRDDYDGALAFLKAQQAFHPDPLEWHSAYAVLLDRQGRFQEAQQAWAHVIQLSKDTEQQQRATLSRARLLSKLEQYESAFNLITQAERQGLFAPSKTTESQLDAYYRLTAEVAQQAGQLTVAIQAWEHLLALAPSSETRFKLANLWFLQGDAEKAFQLLQPLQQTSLPESPDQAHTWYHTLGNVAFQAGHLRTAYEAYQRALALQDNPETRLQVAEVAWQLERYSDVITLLKPLAAHTDDSDQESTLPWRLRLCSAYAKQTQYAQATACAEALAVAHPDNSDVLTTLGNVAFQAGQLDKAFEAYQHVLSLQDTPDTRLKASEVAWQLGRYSDVIELLQPVAARPGDSRQKAILPWELRLCNAYAKQGQSAQAMACAESLVEVDPQDVETLDYLGNLAFEAGLLETAFNAYTRALARRDSLDTRLKAAEVAWQLERYDDVVDLLQPVVTQAEASPASSTGRWQQRLCHAYAKQAQYPSALTCIASLLQAYPHDPDVLIEAAHVASQANEPERQLDYLRQLYQLKPRPELALDIGYLLRRLHLDAEAGDWFRRAYREDQSAIGGLAYAQFLLQYQERDDAIEILRDIVERPDQLSRAELLTAYTALGYALVDSEDFSGAADVWRQAYELNGDPLFKLRQLRALRKAGQTEQAQEELGALVLDTLPDGKEAEWYEEIGIIWYELGSFEHSLAAMQKAIALAPTASRWAQLSDTLVALSRSEEADNALAEALTLSPDTPAYLRRRGYVQLALHRDRSAVTLLEQSRDAGETDLALDGDLGYLYTRLSDYDSAVISFKRAIDDEPRYLANAPDKWSEVQVQMVGMRSDLQSIERRWSFTLLNNTCMVDDGCRIDNTATDDGSVGQTLGSIEVAYQPPKVGFRNGRIFQLFSRLFWSYDPDAWSFDIDEDSLQIGLGARYKPFSRHNLWLSLEHLFEIGDDTDNNWLARLSWSHTRGAGWYLTPNGELPTSELYLTLYADVAKFFQHDEEWVLTGTTRLGWTFNRGPQWQLSPFAYGVAQGTFDDDPMTAYVEAGAGLALRFRFRFDHYWGYQHYFEVFSQVGHDLINSDGDRELRALIGLSLNL